MNHNNNGLTAKQILKTAGIIQLGPGNKLSEAISKFKSSHDAVMLVEDEQFFGLVNPYYALIKRVYPPATKLAHCLFSPPRLHLETPLSEVARLMLESKVHYLPVLDKANRLLGIVTARRVLRAMLGSERVNSTTRDLVETKAYLQTINLSSNFDEVLRFFERSKLSKIVVVNEKNNLQGIISVFDLLPIFQEPKERMHMLDRSEPIAKLKQYSIKEFLKTQTINVNLNTNLKTVINLILEKEIGSVIVMKNNLQPENIITTSDLLRFLFSKSR